MNHNSASIREFLIYFLKLGTIGFGGPIVLVEKMRTHLVEERKWITETEFNNGMALCQIAPGPLAAQLAMYIGYLKGSFWGGFLTGLAFILPSLIIVILLSILYTTFEGLPLLQSLFLGIGGCVVGIITISAYKLIRKTVKNDPTDWFILITLALITFIYKQEFASLILLSGLIYYAAKSRLSFSFIPVLLVKTSGLVATKQNSIASNPDILWFFTKAGAFVFGSGLAIIPFLYGGVVVEYQWLNEIQFLDAVAIAMITPGPVVITVAFIGYLVGGLDGALLAAAGVFLPCYFFTVLFAPFFDRLANNGIIRDFVKGITIGAIGAISGAVLVIAQKQINGVFQLFVALLTVLILVRFKKIPEPVIILSSALLGILINLIK